MIREENGEKKDNDMKVTEQREFESFSKPINDERIILGLKIALPLYFSSIC